MHCSLYRPNHDTICAFRRENGEAVKQAFAEVVQLARQMGLVKLGTARSKAGKLEADRPH